MKRLFAFITYHNAVPLLMGAFFLTAGGALAASPEVRDAVLSSEQVVRSVDNSYIASVDLGAFVPKVQITGVTEDDERYYVSYILTTIDVVDYIWREVDKNEVMKVSKADLKERDLGLYVTKQLKEVIDWQLAHLKETQTIEKRVGVTPKVVATEYSGLVGKFLDPAEETLPGYVPVKPPEPERPVITGADVAAAVAREFEAQQAAQAATASPSSSTGEASSTQTEAPAGDTTPPTITILGNNPATIDVGVAYNDLGAAITDNVNSNLGYMIAVSGVSMDVVSIDTSVAGEHAVTYTATDQAGNTATATRTVIVGSPSSEAVPEAPTASTTPETAIPEEPEQEEAEEAGVGVIQASAPETASSTLSQ